MKRREFLKLLSAAAVAGGIVLPDLGLTRTSYFLPPREGWAFTGAEWSYTCSDGDHIIDLIVGRLNAAADLMVDAIAKDVFNPAIDNPIFRQVMKNADWNPSRPLLPQVEGVAGQVIRRRDLPAFDAPITSHWSTDEAQAQIDKSIEKVRLVYDPYCPKRRAYLVK